MEQPVDLGRQVRPSRWVRLAISGQLRVGAESSSSAVRFKEKPVIVDCAHYRDGRRQHQGPMELARAAQICLEDTGFVWLGLCEPDQAELDEVQQRFGLHDLAVEDAQSFHLRPKIEQFEDTDILFAVLRTARYVEDLEEVEFGEVSVFMSRRFLVTVR